MARTLTIALLGITLAMTGCESTSLMSRPKTGLSEDGCDDIAREEYCGDDYYTEVYFVEDLLEPYPDYDNLGDEYADICLMEPIDEVMELIQDCVDPESWGQDASIRSFCHLLVINQDAANHAGIAELISQLRTAVVASQNNVPAVEAQDAFTLIPTGGNEHYVRIYAISDLLNANAVYLANEYDDERMPYGSESHDYLIEIIHDHVMPVSWGRDASFRSFHDYLVIVQTEEGHSEIAFFLMLMREALETGHDLQAVPLRDDEAYLGIYGVSDLIEMGVAHSEAYYPEERGGENAEEIQDELVEAVGENYSPKSWTYFSSSGYGPPRGDVFAGLLLIHQRDEEHQHTAAMLAKLRAAMADPRFQESLTDSPPPPRPGDADDHPTRGVRSPP